MNGLQMISVLFLLHFRLLFAHPCTFTNEANLTNGRAFGTAAELTTCLGALDDIVTDLELGNFINTVIKYVENSPYPLLYLDGPNGRTPFNTLGKLQTLKGELASWRSGGKTVLQFYQRIQEIMVELKDPHASVVFPFLGASGYALPYGFAPVSGVGNENYFKLVPNQFTRAYLNATEDTDYTNYVITEIKYGTQFKSAAAAFSDFSSEVSDQDDNPHGTFNYIIKQGNIFSALELISPELKYGDVNEGKVPMKGKSSIESATVIDLSIPWLGSILTNEDNFSDLSPLKKNDASAERRSQVNNPDLGKKKILEVLRDIRRMNQISPVQIEKAKFLKKLREEFGDDSVMKSEKHSSHWLTNAEINLVPIYMDENDYGICNMYVDSTNKIGYIRHTAYMQNIDDPEDFISTFANKYKEMVNAGVENVIYDVRGNRGGMVYLVSKMLEFFFPNTVYPSDPDYDAMFSGYNQLMTMFNHVYSEFSDYKIVDGTKVYFDVIDPLPSIRTLSNKTSETTTTFQQQFTQRSYMTQGSLQATIMETYGGYSPFDSQHFYIVTDAACSSGCGVMTRTAIEARAARVLGYGRNPTVASNDKYYPGNCPGTLLNTDAVENVRAAMMAAAAEIPPGAIPGLFPGFNSLQEISDLLPPAFEREGVQMGVTHHEFFSPNPSRRDQTLFFVQARVADVLPFQVSSEVEVIDDLNEIAAAIKTKYIDDSTVCLAGEVKRDDVACPESEHQVFGKSCDAGSFTGACAFAHCEFGYYLAKSNPITCDHICPEGQTLSNSGVCECPTGQSMTDSGVCECPAGQSMTGAGVCEKDSGSKVFTPVLVIVLLLCFMMV